ncbi:acyl-CoA dehydrogenase family protein, partial [Klebsiella pneumoniae]
KRYFLPRIVDCTDWWCQGYSEPGSGSDLASVKTRAVREGDHYIVNGQKTWTTLGQHADMIFCLVRTDPDAKKQEGISFLLIDMKTPGITVRPIIMLDEEHEVNEVFFDNVKVPVQNLIGDENRGWT